MKPMAKRPSGVVWRRLEHQPSARPVDQHVAQDRSIGSSIQNDSGRLGRLLVVENERASNQLAGVSGGPLGEAQRPVTEMDRGATNVPVAKMRAKRAVYARTARNKVAMDCVDAGQLDRFSCSPAFIEGVLQ